MKKHNLAFIDVETTGLDPELHEIIELGYIVARQIPSQDKGPYLEVIQEGEYKIKPNRIDLADQESLRINNYDAEKWLFAADLKNVMKDFAKHTQGATLVAHNVIFDYAFLSKAFEKSGVKNTMHYHKIDTLSMAFGRLYHDVSVRSFSLASLCAHYDIKNEQAHSALSDTRAMFELYKKIVNVE